MAKRTSFTEPLTDEERELIRQRAHKIWKARSDDGKTFAADDWAEAIEQLRAERSFPGKRAREAGTWFWQITGLKGKTLWDGLQLLVVPLTLAIVGFGLQEFAKQRDEKIADANKQKDQQIADDRARQDTLVKYLSEMSDLLQNGLLRSSANSEKVIIAQAKTVTVLQSLDAKRQHLVIQFLDAANLNTLNKNGVLYKARLSKADLTGSDFSGIVLIGADLSRAKLSCLHPDAVEADRQCADLNGANLTNADLIGANLTDANLIGVYLNGASLDRAYLNGANLIGAYLTDADLGDADLSGADLSGAYLRDADLSYAILINVDLTSAQYLTKEQLEGATPPYLCKVKLPRIITIDPNRDCKQLPKILHDRDPDTFKTIEDAQRYIDQL